MFRPKTYLVHDETNEVRAGDVVIMKTTHKLSKRKAHFVRNIERQGARFDYWDAQNAHRREILQNEVKKQLEILRQNELSKIHIKNAKHSHELRLKLKRKAMVKAIQEIRNLERQGM